MIEVDPSGLVVTASLEVGDRINHEGEGATVTAMMAGWSEAEEPAELVLVGLDHDDGLSSWHFVAWSHTWLRWAE